MDRLVSNRAYDCFCGTGVSLDFACSYILENSNLPENTSSEAPVKVAILSDRAVSGYYYNQFENQFIIHGIRPVLISLEAGQTGKNLNSVNEVLKYLVDFEFGKCDWLIGFGGGGILDVAGFASAIYTPGVNLMYIPTTLNAMAEGAVAKNACINCGSHKSAATLPVYPKCVFADPMYLKTVPSKIKSNGNAAVLRLALLEKPELVRYLNSPANELREFLNMVYSARSSVEKKNPLLLTLGDEISGAIESYFRFMNYSEGEALALSLLSIIPAGGQAPFRAQYNALGLPTSLSGVSPAMILKNLRTSFVRRGLSEVTFVDLNAGKWVIQKASVDDAMEIFSKRLAKISEGSKNA